MPLYEAAGWKTSNLRVLMNSSLRKIWGSEELLVVPYDPLIFIPQYPPPKPVLIMQAPILRRQRCDTASCWDLGSGLRLN